MNNYNAPEKLYCQFCNKLCKNQNSLKQHQIRCKHNPDKIKTTVEGFNNIGRTAWNTDLTKDTDDRVLNSSLAVKKYYETHPGKFTGKNHSEEYKVYMSNIAKDRGLGGFNMRKAKITYNDIKLDSSYELKLAVSLDNNNVKWTRCKRFAYHYDDGSLHYYTPDFYLPDYDVYLDPKNDFLIENINQFTGMTDVEKIERAAKENNIRVIILDKDNLNWEYIQTLLYAPVA